MIALGLGLMGCGDTSKAKKSTMTEQETKKLKNALEHLDTILKDKAPFISKKLGVPASEEDIMSLRKGIGDVEIQCLEEWYRWHNGCIDHTTDILPLGRMLTIRESIDDRTMIQKIPFVDSKRKKAIKILDDSAGDGFFLDISSDKPSVFYHMLEDPYPRDYGTLADFIDFIKEVHSSGISSVKDNGMTNFDLDKYKKLETEYLNKMNKP